MPDSRRGFRLQYSYSAALAIWFINKFVFARGGWRTGKLPNQMEMDCRKHQFAMR